MNTIGWAVLRENPAHHIQNFNGLLVAKEKLVWDSTKKALPRMSKDLPKPMPRSKHFLLGCSFESFADVGLQLDRGPTPDASRSEREISPEVQIGRMEIVYQTTSGVKIHTGEVHERHGKINTTRIVMHLALRSAASNLNPKVNKDIDQILESRAWFSCIPFCAVHVVGGFERRMGCALRCSGRLSQRSADVSGTLSKTPSSAFPFPTNQDFPRS